MLILIKKSIKSLFIVPTGALKTEIIGSLNLRLSPHSGDRRF